MDTDVRQLEDEKLRMRCIEMVCSIMKRENIDDVISESITLLANDFLEFAKKGFEDI